MPAIDIELTSCTCITQGLWAGNFVNCLRVIPSKATLFLTNDLYKAFFRVSQGIPENGQLPMEYSFLAGGSQCCNSATPFR
jgi:hypothetical protein